VATEPGQRGRLPDLRLDGSAVLCTVVVAIVAFVVVYPLWLLLVNSFQVGAFGRPTTWGFENWANAFTQPGLSNSIVNTITLAVTRQVLALLIGVPAAWLLARTDLPAKRWLEFGFWIAVFLPPLTVLVGWIMLFDGYAGIANKWLQPLLHLSQGPFEIFSWWGITFVHLVGATLGVKIMVLTPAFRNLDASLEEASRASGASTPGTLLRISAPLLAPAILVVTLLGIISSLEAFEVELVLGRPSRIDVFSTMIYRLAREQPPAYGSATALSMVVLLLMVPLILLQQWIVLRRSYATMSGKYRAGLVHLGRWRWWLFGVLAALVSLMTVVPTLLVLVGSFMRGFGAFDIDRPWTASNWTEVLGSSVFREALINTLVLASATAVVSMAAFALVAYISVRTRFRLRGALDFLTWIPSLLPGMVIGLGLLWFFLTTPVFRPVYGSMLVLVLAVSISGMTRAVQLLKASLLQLGNELEEASWASGAARLATVRAIIVPLIAPTLVVVGIVAFSSASRTASQVALLASAANRPLSLVQLDYLTDGRFEPASVIGVVVLVLTIGAAALAYLVGLRDTSGVH
jgi:iron(III) transport system permease protein